MAYTETENGLEITGPETDRCEFLQQIEAECKEKLEEKGIVFPCDNYTFLRIGAVCGCVLDFASADDVPLENVACEHGNSLLLWQDVSWEELVLE